jgi:hypothetical protein
MGTMGVDTLYAVVPGLSLRLRSLAAEHLSVNAKYFALSFQNDILVLDRRKPDVLKLREFVTVTESFRYLKLDDDRLLIGRCFEYGARPAIEPTMLTYYDLTTHSFGKAIHPPFKGIGLTHYAPFHPIDVMHGRVAFAQTLRYSISIFDSDLNRTSVIEPQTPNWREFNSAVLNRYVLSKEGGRGNISLLDSEESVAGRVESVDFLNDTSLVVRIIPPGGDIFPRKRVFDVWRLTHGEWKLTQSGLMDVNPDDAEIRTKENFPLGSGYSNHHVTFIGDSLVIAVQFASRINQLGMTNAALKALAKDQSRDEPVLTAFVYRINSGE